ncbi:MAG: rod-binding protein [Veillonellales bacterium]
MGINSIDTQTGINNYKSGQIKAVGALADKLEKSAAGQSGISQDDIKLKHACRDMEAVFLNLLLTEMRKTVPKSSLLGDQSQEELMTSMLDSEMTKNMAQAGGIGLADMLYRQLRITTAKGNFTGQAPK